MVITSWVDATSLAYGAYVGGTFAGRSIVPGWPAQYNADYSYRLRAGCPVYVIVAGSLSLKHASAQQPVALDGNHVAWRVLPFGR